MESHSLLKRRVSVWLGRKVGKSGGRKGKFFVMLDEDEGRESLDRKGFHS